MSLKQEQQAEVLTSHIEVTKDLRFSGALVKAYSRPVMEVKISEIPMRT